MRHKMWLCACFNWFFIHIVLQQDEPVCRQSRVSLCLSLLRVIMCALEWFLSERSQKTCASKSNLLLTCNNVKVSVTQPCVVIWQQADCVLCVEDFILFAVGCLCLFIFPLSVCVCVSDSKVSVFDWTVRIALLYWKIIFCLSMLPRILFKLPFPKRHFILGCNIFIFQHTYLTMT